MTDEAEFLAAANAPVIARLDQLQSECREKMDTLGTCGAMLDPSGMLSLRLEILIEMLIPSWVTDDHDVPLTHGPDHNLVGSPERGAFEIVYHERLSAALDGLVQDATRNKLTQGIGQHLRGVR